MGKVVIKIVQCIPVVMHRAKSCISVFLAGMFLLVRSETFAVGLRCIV